MLNASPPASHTLAALLEAARNGTRTLIMGVLNVTPDSFSDGGLFFDEGRALAHAEQMVQDGADILDIGGESTRPATFRSQTPLSADDELHRILPIVEAIQTRMPNVPISVDTYKAQTARQAVQSGAAMVNDISAGRADPAMLSTVAELEVPICLMHLLGLPTQIPEHPVYRDVVQDVKAHLEERVVVALAAGIVRDALVIDPGIGFGKTVGQNLELLRRQRELLLPGIPLLIGTSRKSTIGRVLGGLPPDDRLEGTAATIAIAIANGASLVRVHDVKAMARVARMSDAVIRGWTEPAI